MLKALKPANAGDLWEGVQNQEIISYSELGPLRDSDKHSFYPIGAPISDLDNKGLFQKSNRYKNFIFYSCMRQMFKTREYVACCHA